MSTGRWQWRHQNSNDGRAYNSLYNNSHRLSVCLSVTETWNAIHKGQATPWTDFHGWWLVYLIIAVFYVFQMAAAASFSFILGPPQRLLTGDPVNFSMGQLIYFYNTQFFICESKWYHVESCGVQEFLKKGLILMPLAKSFTQNLYLKRTVWKE